MSSFLFTYGVGVADDRERSWDPHLRTLPAPAWPRIAGRLLTGGLGSRGWRASTAHQRW